MAVRIIPVIMIIDILFHALFCQTALSLALS